MLNWAIKKILLHGHLSFALCMLLLCFIGNCSIAYNSSRLWGLLESMVDVYALTFLIALLPASIARIIKIIVSCILYFVTAVDLGLIITTGQPINPTLLMMCMQTNISEATEATAVYFSVKAIILTLVCICPIALLQIYLSRAREYAFCFGSCTKKWIAISIALGFIFACSVFNVEKKYKYRRLILQQSEIELQRTEDLEPRTKFNLPIYRLWDSLVQMKRMESIYETLRSSQAITEELSCDFTSPEIILILGESFSRHHSSLYGYEKDNTPYQKEWEEHGNLIKFTDAISRWNTTCESIQSLLSLSYAGDSLDWYERPFITSMMRKAGYNVSLVSNQYTLDSSKNFSDYIEDIFINIPEVSELQFDHRNKNTAELDNVLLEEYDSICNLLTDDHRFTIIHTRGMHFDFSKRYPEGFGKFCAKDYQDYDNLTEDQKTIIANYDNAILYNDFVINQILLRCKDRNAIVIFVPDHGERVYDYDENFGRFLGLSYNEVIPQHEIPMWIWGSDQYRATHVHEWSKIQQVCDLPYMTDALPHTIITLAGIETKQYNIEVDILSDSYDQKRPRIIRNEKDFDEIKRR